MNQQAKKPNRVEARRKMRTAVVMTPAGPRSWPSKARLRRNKGRKLRRLRIIANGRERAKARIAAVAAVREAQRRKALVRWLKAKQQRGE